ncbi:MAG: hypothetical protein AWM53_01984 [Candidatus Dichloromethanomonas elyunquensis]|nr:MAG: hypothetical protein AWM53_01984 [Candidatus Dichloromethanomonas elyunquensis]
MKIIALFSACLMWLILFLFLKVRLKFTYRFQNFISYCVTDFRILFSTLKIELTIPKEMYSTGFNDILENILKDTLEPEDCAPEKSGKPKKKSIKRYEAFKNFLKEIASHYVFSFAGFVWLKRKMQTLGKHFCKKIDVYALEGYIQVGGRDAAETGLLTGVFWAMFGLVRARLFRLVTIKKNKINFMVKPCFDDGVFLCRVHCILNLKISHIIFTGYKFLLLIFKNRRIRTYGRTSN